MNPRVGVSVILVRDDKVLIGKRKGSHGAGCWAFPGGHLEHGESFEDCVRREVLEETGALVKNICFSACTNDVFSAEKHYVTVFLRAEYAGGEIRVREPEKCEGWVWCKWSELQEPLFLPLKNLLKSGFKLN